MNFWRPFKAFVFSGLLLAVIGPAARAEGDGADLRYPFLEQSRRSPEHRQVSPQKTRSTFENPTRRVRPSVQTPFTVPVSDPEKPPVQATTILTVIGDSLGVQLGQGLREALAGKPEIGIVNKAKADTGLVNTSERDWPKVAREIAASPDKNNMTIIMIGSNDNQPLRDETGAYQEAGSDKWREIYIRRIDDMIAPFKEKKTQVIWVGMPVMKPEKLTSRLLVFNELYRDRIQKAGFTYVDIWEAFADEQGKYSASGPDIGGQIVKLRTVDGVHFTKPGARKLAFFVERDLLKLLGDGGKKTDVPVMPEELREQIKLQSAPEPAAPPANFRNAVPIPDAATLSPVLQKREAGPIAPLTAPPIAPAGQLASGLLPSGKPDASIAASIKLSEDVFSEGKAPYPKPNRGDDFSWPRR